jgi:hypothetical protein
MSDYGWVGGLIVVLMASLSAVSPRSPRSPRAGDSLRAWTEETRKRTAELNAETEATLRRVEQLREENAKRREENRKLFTSLLRKPDEEAP